MIIFIYHHYQYLRPTDGGEYEAQELNARLFVKAGNIPVNQFSDNNNIVFEGNKYNVGYAFFAKQLLTNEVLDTSLNQ